MHFRRRHNEAFKYLMDTQQASKAPTLLLTSESTRASACSLFNVIEADYLQTWDISLADDSSLNQTPNIIEIDREMMNNPKDELDTGSIEMLIKKLSMALSKTYDVRKRSCRLLVSPEMVRRISADVVRMSQLEPHGVEGGRLKVRLAFDGCETELCQISKGDENENEEKVLYEIILTLSEDHNNWSSLRQLAQLLPTIVCCRLNHPRRHTFVCIGQGYMLEKIKFYSQNSYKAGDM